MNRLWLVGLLALAACSPDTPPVAQDAAILIRGNGPEPDSLDPQRARSTEAHTILRDLCEGLTTLARDASVAPGVARSWSHSADGKTYTFQLRPEARWSNGDAVVAADFVAGLRRLVDPGTASQYAQFIDAVLNARDVVSGKKPPTVLGVTATDDATLVIQLEAPAPYFTGLLSHPSTCPVHRETPEKVWNGAFVLKEWQIGSHVLLARNTHYWNNAATRLDGVRYLHIADENAELIRYRADQLHITAFVPRSQLDWIHANIVRELHVVPRLGTFFYGFNLDRPPFANNLRLRRALSMVIDRDKLAQLVLRAGEVPAYGWVPPGIQDYTSQYFDYRSTSPEQRLIQARQLYAAAGYSREEPLRFELSYNVDDINNKLAVAISSMWKEALGVEAKLVGMEFKSLLQAVDDRQVDIFRMSWGGDYNDAYTFAQFFQSDFGINTPHYKNAEYDDLLKRAAVEIDTSERRDLLQQAERIVLRDHPIIPIYFHVNKHLVKPAVRGWYDNVMNVVYSKDLSLDR